MRLKVIAAMSAIGAALFAGGCSSARSSAPTSFDGYFDQVIDWGDCGSGFGQDFQCATIAAPTSWRDPSIGSIDVALIRRAALGDDSLGSLLFNFGGPGGSGVEALNSAYFRLAIPIRQNFDIVSFDQRGVGRSTRVICGTDAEKYEFLTADFTDDDAGLAELAERNAAWGQACYTNTGALLGNVDAMSVARDMELMRHLLGDEKLNFIGFSYGSRLGTAYAGLFPNRVGRFVLDGVVPSLSPEEWSLGQAVGFENALRSYVTDCLTQLNCPFTGTADQALAKVTALLLQARETPFPTTTGRYLNRSLLSNGIAVNLYSQNSWTQLTNAFAELINRGRGDLFLRFAETWMGKNPDGSFNSDLFTMISVTGCLRGAASADPETMATNAQYLIEAAPTMGWWFSHGGLTCRDWPVPPVIDDFDVHATGAPPILVIGTTGDSATPYEWAVHLADTLDSGVLLTLEREQHTAYLSGNHCIDRAVNEFLLTGELPPDGKICR